MICSRCGRDSKYPERRNRACPGCLGVFAFEPRTGDPITDVGFRKAIEAVSAKGAVRWGVEHLYYEICRRANKRGLSMRGFMVILALMAAGFMIAGIWIPPLLAGIALVGVVALLVRSAGYGRFVSMTEEKFDTLWRRWLEVHESPAGLIMRVTQPAAPRGLESDVADYSFDRAVICDRARTVDLLLANNFHFENNCAILSIGGYPKGPFEMVREMLRRNPRLEVFALHDATPQGCRLAHQLRTDPEWFGGTTIRVVDAGLRPRQAKWLKGLWRRATDRAVSPGEGISQEEAQWLREQSLDLAAIRPEQVLKRLFKTISLKAVADDATTGTSSGDGGTYYYHDSGSMTSDAGDSDDGADSFG